MSVSEFRWPPQYKVRESSRAKRMHLKISAATGLVVVIPHNCSKEQYSKFINAKRNWIEKHLGRIQQQIANQKPISLPRHIPLRTVEQIWQVEYIESDNKTTLLHRPHQQLAVLGDTNDTQSCKLLLTNWLKQQAKQELLPRLERLSQTTGLNYRNATIRDQQTRWGSCSAKKAINLNYKLLFLPSNLTKHIMIHELCHTVHLNHSNKFWHLVEHFDPSWQQHKRACLKVDQFIPLWLEY